MWATFVESPLGPLRVVCSSEAIVGIYFPEHHPPPAVSAPDGVHSLLDQAREELNQWFAGDRTAFDVPTSAAGSDFQRTVWTVLRTLEFGQTTTYAELARMLDRPIGAARAVGTAVGRPPLSIIIPCHRVVGAGGKLTGYAGGVWRKRWLLAHESGEGTLFAGR